MTTATTKVSSARKPELLGQTLVVIGGSAGIGLETARRARAESADVVLTARNPERLESGPASYVAGECDSGRVRAELVDRGRPLVRPMTAAPRGWKRPSSNPDGADVYADMDRNVILAEASAMVRQDLMLG